VKRSPIEKTRLAFQYTLLALFAALLLLKAYSTLDWRMEHDTPILHYAAFLMDKHGLVPYRDIFETSMPGTFAFHYLIGKLFGYGDVPFRYVDLTLLSILLVATYVFMRRFGRLVASWAAILFGLVYLSAGQTMSLQKDYVGIIPIALALLCIPAKTDGPVRLARFALVGLLFGLSVLIKPQLGIALPIVFGTLLVFRWHSQRKSTRDFLKCAAVTGAALLVPVGITLVWLAANAALVPFINIMFNYLPLYNSMTGSHETISELAFVVYLIEKTFTFGGLGVLLLSSLFAYYHVVTHAGEDRATTISLTGLCLCTLAYAVYPTLAGKFWPYHYVPLAFFCSISVGLLLYAGPQPPTSRWMRRMKETLLLLALVIVVAVQLSLPQYVDSLASDLRSGSEAHAPKGGRVDEIAGWLQGRLQPGDSVQPLDWTGGSIHGMLLAEAQLATPFMADYVFYHHVSSACVQGLRQTFMSQLRTASPRFIIEVLTNKPWVSGIDTTREFPELRQFLDDDYAVAYEGDGYLIHERMNAAPSQEARPGAAPEGNSAALACRW
jgi:4-amino-4-deoxy-L-arabinose transferase-like glycosyltransferase